MIARPMQVCGNDQFFYILDLSLFVTGFGGFKKCSRWLSLRDGPFKGTHERNKKILAMSRSDNFQPNRPTLVVEIRHRNRSDRIAYNGRQSRAQLKET